MKRFLGLVCAALCLAASARAEDVASLVKQLKSPDEELRRAAAKGLGELGPDAKPAVPDLTRALKDGDLFVRRFAAQALGEVGPDAKAAVPALKEALGDKKKEVGEAAAAALARLGPDGVAALTDLLKDAKKDAAVRRKAVEALGRAGDDAKPAVPALTDLLKDRDLRTDAAAALGDLGPVAKDDKVLAALEDAADKKNKDRGFRQTAQDALRKIQGKPPKKK
jgi:HEAT repeat protein